MAKNLESGPRGPSGVAGGGFCERRRRNRGSLTWLLTDRLPVLGRSLGAMEPPTSQGGFHIVAHLTSRH